MTFNLAGMLLCPYDASRYDGISFYAKGSGTVSVQVGTSPTRPISEGGTCLAGCYDNYQATIRLTNDWVLHEILWSELVRSGWGSPAVFSPAEITMVIFQLPSGVVFDVYVDDLSLI